MTKSEIIRMDNEIITLRNKMIKIHYLKNRIVFCDIEISAYSRKLQEFTIRVTQAKERKCIPPTKNAPATIKSILKNRREEIKKKKDCESKIRRIMAGKNRRKILNEIKALEEKLSSANKNGAYEEKNWDMFYCVACKHTTKHSFECGESSTVCIGEMVHYTFWQCPCGNKIFDSDIYEMGLK